jgi:uncharacterized membrane protein
MAEQALPSVPLTELTQDQKAFAGLAHALMMGTWWIGPLVIYLTKKESRFVAFHSLQALLWQIVFTIVYMFAMGIWLITIISTVALHPQNLPNQPFPIAVFVVMPVFLLLIFGAIAINLTLAIIYCLKAMRGEWAGYPVIGDWARKIVCG